MDELSGKTAVVTGAASGMGLAMANRFAGEGMRVVLADIEEAPLEAAEKLLRDEGAEVVAVHTDVSDGDAVDALAEAATAAFGDVHVLCNNAGVGTGGLLRDLTTADWQWVLGVNLWGVIHGIRAFLPRMLAHGKAGHIVNTASLAGHISAPMLGPYGASKFAVVSISETLHHELTMLGSALHASVLCPGWVNTNIHASERNRPAALGPAAQGEGDPRGELLRQVLQTSLASEVVAGMVVDAIRNERFWIFTHPEMHSAVEQRWASIRDGTNPELRLSL